MVVTYNIIQYSVPFAVVGTMGFKMSQLFPCSIPPPSPYGCGTRAPCCAVPALLQFPSDPALGWLLPQSRWGKLLSCARVENPKLGFGHRPLAAHSTCQGHRGSLLTMLCTKTLWRQRGAVAELSPEHREELPVITEHRLVLLHWDFRKTAASLQEGSSSSSDGARSVTGEEQGWFLPFKFTV